MVAAHLQYLLQGSKHLRNNPEVYQLYMNFFACHLFFLFENDGEERCWEVGLRIANGFAEATTTESFSQQEWKFLVENFPLSCEYSMPDEMFAMWQWVLARLGNKIGYCISSMLGIFTGPCVARAARLLRRSTVAFQGPPLPKSVLKHHPPPARTDGEASNPGPLRIFDY